MTLIFIFSQEKLRSIASYLNLVPPKEREKEENWYRLDIEFLRELLVGVRKRREKHKFERLLNMTLDSEKTLFHFRYRDTSVGRHNLRS